MKHAVSLAQTIVNQGLEFSTFYAEKCVLQKVKFNHTTARSLYFFLASI